MKEVAIITGASGGIGYEIALLFAQQKIDIVIVARNEKKLQNIKFAKVGVSCFYESLVKGSSSVFHLNICAKNRRLRKYEKR